MSLHWLPRAHILPDEVDVRVGWECGLVLSDDIHPHYCNQIFKHVSIYLATIRYIKYKISPDGMVQAGSTLLIIIEYFSIQIMKKC